MKYDPAFIEAIKRCIHANVMVWRKMGGAGEEKARKEYSEAEAHLDSFGGESDKVDNSFGCLCPEGKKNGDNGIFHLTPIDCSPEEK